MKNRFLLLLLLLGFQVSFSQSAEQYVDDSIQVNEHNVPLQKGQYYFPVSCFPYVKVSIAIDEDSVFYFKHEIQENVYDTFSVAWYSDVLFALQEPLLFNKPIKKEVYRFTWIRTFHNPIAIRVERENDRYSLTWKRCKGAGGYGIGKLASSKSKKISKSDWDTFMGLLEACDFWKVELVDDVFGLDGAEWILEGNDSQNYRALSDWSPDEGSYYEACLYLIKLAKIRLKKGMLY